MVSEITSDIVIRCGSYELWLKSKIPSMGKLRKGKL